MTRLDPPPCPDSRFSRAPHTSWRRIGDETVVLDQNGHRLFGLNDAAGTVWHRLDASRTARELTSASGVTMSDVISFLAQLADLGLVELQQGPVLVKDAPKPLPQPLLDEQPAAGAPPAITWQEALQNAAQTSGGCAFLPAQNPLCNSAPFS